MSHTIKHKSKLLARVSRLRGQIEAIGQALETERPCGEILNLVASVRGAVLGLTTELIEDHIREHISDPNRDADVDRAEASAALIELLRRYLK